MGAGTMAAESADKADEDRIACAAASLAAAWRSISFASSMLSFLAPSLLLFLLLVTADFALLARLSVALTVTSSIRKENGGDEDDGLPPAAAPASSETEVGLFNSLR